MVKKIAVEEHCLFPGLQEYWAPTVADLPAKRREGSLARLTDFGDMRLEVMDKAGIERCVLSVAGPGVQAERDTQTACKKAREANDLLAREIDKRPKRYAGFAHLAMQDAAAAADELERCMRELKFCGAMINGHTHGKYLDARAFDPFWERAQALDALIYLHPADRSPPRPSWTDTKGCGGPPGNGRSRPARTLCASCSGAYSIAFRARASPSAI
jgi:2,3-dihydroxybenzoate decarboxylase